MEISKVVWYLSNRTSILYQSIQSRDFDTFISCISFYFILSAGGEIDAEEDIKKLLSEGLWIFSEILIWNKTCNEFSELHLSMLLYLFIFKYTMNEFQLFGKCYMKVLHIVYFRLDQGQEGSGRWAAFAGGEDFKVDWRWWV